MDGNKTILLTPAQPKYRLIWKAVEDAVLIHLHNTIQQLVDQAKETFFTISSKAQTSKEQNQAYQAVKALKEQEPPLEDIFCQAIKTKISQLNNTETHDKKKPLSLLSDAELELNVAISAMTSRLLAETVLEREKLYGYLQSLFPNTSKDNFWDEYCPFSPSGICHIFGDIVLPLKMPTSCQLTFLKLFEQSITKSLISLYTELNQFLADNGLSPLKTTTYPDEQAEDKNYRTILKKQLNALHTLGVTAPEMSFAYNTHNPNNQETIATEHLITSLKNHPRSQETAPLSATTIKDAIKHAISDAHQQTLKPDDFDTIHLLSLFFSHLLNNSSISTEVRLQISRLQLPVLTLTLQDQDFFENDAHPARQLINLLGDIGKVCPAVSGDNCCTLLSHITQATSRLCSMPSVTADDFINARLSIEEFYKVLEKKAGKLQQRFALSLQGQINYQKAQKSIDRFLFQSLQSVVLPEIIMDFITGEWRTVLIRTYLRSKKGNAWEIAQDVTNDLLDTASQSTANKIVGTNTKALCRQIQQCIEIASAAGEPIFYSLEKINDVLNLVSSDPTHNTLNWVTLRQEDLVALHHTKEEQQLDWKQQKQEERLDLRYQATSENSRLKVGKLTIGDSIQFLDRFSDKTFRGTIAAQFKESNQFLFVDVSGFRLFEKTYQEIAYELERKRALIHEKQFVFEQSMLQIQEQLQSLRDETTSLH